MDKNKPWPANDRQHSEDAYRFVLRERFNDAEWRISSEEILGDFGFRVLWGVSDTWANVAAFVIEQYEDSDAGWEAEFTPDDDSVRGLTPHVYEAEPYLQGYVKWDGCAELDQGGPHWCGAKHFKRHMKLLEHVYKRAMELMGRSEYPWDDNDTEAAASHEHNSTDKASNG